MTAKKPSSPTRQLRRPKANRCPAKGPFKYLRQVRGHARKSFWRRSSPSLLVSFRPVPLAGCQSSSIRNMSTWKMQVQGRSIHGCMHSRPCTIYDVPTLMAGQLRWRGRCVGGHVFPSLAECTPDGPAFPTKYHPYRVRYFSLDHHMPLHVKPAGCLNPPASTSTSCTLHSMFYSFSRGSKTTSCIAIEAPPRLNPAAMTSFDLIYRPVLGPRRSPGVSGPACRL